MLLRRILIPSILLFIVGSVSGIFSDQINRVYQNAKATQQNSLEAAYSAALILPKSDQSKQVCTTITDLISNENNLEQLYYAANAYAAYDCKEKIDLGAKLEELQMELMEQPPKISSILYISAVSSVLKLKLGKEYAKFIETGFEALCDKNKGLCRESEEVGLDSFYATSQMFEIGLIGSSIGLLSALVKSISEFGQKNSAKLLETIAQNGKVGLGDENFVQAISKSIILADKYGVKNLAKENVQKLSDMLKEFVEVGAPLDSGLLYSALKVLGGFSNFPLVLSQLTARVSPEEKIFVVDVTDVMGKKFSGLCNIQISGAGVSNGAMKKDSSGVYVFEFSKIPKLGSHDLDVSASCQSGESPKILSAKMNVLFQGGLLVKENKAQILVVVGSEVNQKEEVQLNQQLKSIKKVSHDQEFHVKMEVSLPGLENFSPHFYMLALTHVESGKQVLIPFQEKIASVSAEKISKQIGTYSGDFSVKIMAGDHLSVSGINWDLGKVQFLQVPLSDGSQPPAPSPSTYDLRHAPKKTITHIMREPDKRPPQIISLAFSGIVFIPVVLVVIIGLPLVGANLRGFPRNVTSQTMMFGFHGALGVILTVYLYYWLFSYSIFSILPVLFAVGASGAVITSKALTIMSEQKGQVRSKTD